MPSGPLAGNRGAYQSARSVVQISSQRGLAADLPAGEDVELRIYIDKHVVEVFANQRQAMIAMHADHLGKPDGKSDLAAFTVGAPTTLKKVEIWKLKPTNQGFLEAQKNRIWEPKIN